MGVVTTNNNGNKTEKTGIFGYRQGIRTFFLNSQNGAAMFGAGTGRIAIDPGNKKVLLYSTNFWKNVNEDGFPNSVEYLQKNDNGEYVKDNSGNYQFNTDVTNGRGMLIDFTAPAIYYGNQDFYVDKDGNMVANKGKIGGWTISTNTISAEKNGETIVLDADSGQISGPNWTLSTAGGQIGGWNIGQNMISRGHIILDASNGQIKLGNNLILDDEGSITGLNWSISSSGVATFNSNSIYIKPAEFGGVSVLLSEYIRNTVNSSPSPA